MTVPLSDGMERPGSLLPQDTRHHHTGWRRIGLQTGIAAVGLLPALLLLASGVAGVGAPGILVNRVLVVGGLLWAAVASLISLTHWEVERAPGEVRLQCTIRKRAGDLVVLLLSLALLLVISLELLLGSRAAR